MIDYSKVKAGDQLRITGMGAPGFAKLGDTVTVEACTANNHGRCDVIHDVTGEKAYFALTCGAQRLEPSPVGNCQAPNGGGHTTADCPGAECRRTGECQVA